MSNKRRGLAIFIAAVTVVALIVIVVLLGSGNKKSNKKQGESSADSAVLTYTEGYAHNFSWDYEDGSIIISVKDGEQIPEGAFWGIASVNTELMSVSQMLDGDGAQTGFKVVPLAAGFTTLGLSLTDASGELFLAEFSVEITSDSDNNLSAKITNYFMNGGSDKLGDRVWYSDPEDNEQFYFVGNEDGSISVFIVTDGTTCIANYDDEKLTVSDPNYSEGHCIFTICGIPSQEVSEDRTAEILFSYSVDDEEREIHATLRLSDDGWLEVADY